MKIVSWNCGSTFGKGLTPGKGIEIQNISSDAAILVIQEINEDECKNIHGFENFKWYGDHYNDEPGGIAVFVQKGYEINFIPKSEFGIKFRYVIPFSVKGEKEFTLVAVWAKGKPYYYTESILLALYEYQINHPAIIIGDFNTGSQKNKDSYYEYLEKGLNNKQFYNCDKADDPSYTFFRGERSYIDDYCFASEKISLSAELIVVDTDKFENQSDHRPIIVDFNF
ncbi:endonuclease/exonuclease/phosphatase family protein [Treponema primitia ZAS-2]|uniref:Endonuclease/exonuclease/phosphatase family protein n=1 Tax=Treponema primitia (strain ATCC BAA-887 / DSM 12427 / ZAS-2) TaxID=545694 RepID=F5YP28_TREPZ|nr:endonuclease/exonuclease/phosphatase family protein [Treponema primitia]AEF85684.1 endonuclease/exonuclease/phosphatase family protein [Treponema primitia ZAS-2]